MSIEVCSTCGKWDNDFCSNGFHISELMKLKKENEELKKGIKDISNKAICMECSYEPDMYQRRDIINLADELLKEDKKK